MESIWNFLKKHLGINFDKKDEFQILNFLIAILLPSLLLKYAISNSIVIGIYLYIFYLLFKKKIKPRIIVPTFFFVSLFLLMCFSWFWSINKTNTLIGIQRNFAFILIPLLFTLLPPISKQKRENILRVFSLSMVIYALFFIGFGIFFYFQQNTFDRLTHHGLVRILGLNRVMVSVFMSFAFFYWLMLKEKSWIRMISIFILAVMLLLLSSKTILIISLILSVIVLYTKLKEAKFKLIRPIILILIIPSVLYLSGKINHKFFTELNPRYTEILTSTNFGYGYYFNGSELRMLYTRFLVEMNNEDHIWYKGYGLNASQQKIKAKTVAYNMWPYYGEHYDFHNQFNQYFAEIGIVGILLLMGIIIYGINYAIKNKEYLFLIWLIVFTFFMFTDTPISQLRGMYLFSIIFYIFTNQKNTISTSKN